MDKISFIEGIKLRKDCHNAQLAPVIRAIKDAGILQGSK